MSLRFIAQPGNSIADTLAALVETAKYSHADVAVAYATVSGVLELRRRMPSGFNAVRKRWLVGIDWCRSEPDALTILDTMTYSTVRIHDGTVVASTPGCHPKLPYHPKGFMFRGSDVAAMVVGSGNLSRNGILIGHEAGVEAVAATGTPNWTAATAARTWFDSLWVAASPLDHVVDTYRTEYNKQRNLAKPTRTDDDAVDPQALARGSFTAADLVQLRACRHFWTEAGTLSENRGRGVPGNQLMLRALTRVFFGFAPARLPKDSHLGLVNISFAGTGHPDRTLRYSNNGMDVLTLPVPGSGGPPAYDDTTVHFTRHVQSGRLGFDMRLAAGSEKRLWRAKSEAIGALFTMSSGRQFGFY